MSHDATPAAGTLSDTVYRQLKDAILQGEFVAGKPLRQDVIARQYGISKIPVREALFRLEYEGFVLFRKNRGAIVRQLSPEEVLDLMEIRVALECKALELAIPNQARSDLARLEQILDHYDDDRQVASRSEMNLRFHNTLYEASGNPRLLEMINDIRQRIGPLTSLIMTETSGVARPDAEHREILAACVQGDVALGVRLLRDHIETTKKETAAKLRQQKNREKAAQ